MPKVTLVRGARQLLTLRGPNGPRRGADLKNLGIIQDGAVLIVDGRIEDVGASRRVENLALARHADEIDASGRVVMPGFVDCYTHLASGPARNPATDPLALARAIRDLSARTLESHTLDTLAQALRHGTTSLETKSGFGLTEANEIKILRVHAAVEKQSLPLVSTFLCAEGSLHMLPLIRRRKLAQFAEISLHRDGFPVEQARQFLTTARELKFGLKLHLGSRYHAEAIPLAIETGVTAVDDAIAVTPDGAALLAQSPIIATLLPGPLFYSHTPDHAPVRMLIESGVAVALATGYHPSSCPSVNMQMMIALACAHMCLTPSEAIAASTINAAFAAGLASTTGSLEAGKSADLLILDTPDYREIPYHFGVNLIDLVMKNGAVVLARSEVKWPAP